MIRLRPCRGAPAWLLIALSAGAAQAHQAAPLQESPHAVVGYPTVDAALRALQVKPGVVITQDHGWLIATDATDLVTWSFVPWGHPAFPAVVKRGGVNRGAGAPATITVLCEASKSACDDLVRTFARSNGLAEPK